MIAKDFSLFVQFRCEGHECECECRMQVIRCFAVFFTLSRLIFLRCVRGEVVGDVLPSQEL